MTLLSLDKGFFASLVALADDAIIAVDDSNGIVFCNEGAERAFGFTKDEVLGQPLDHLLPEQIHDDHRLWMHEFGTGVGNAKRMGQRNQIMARRKDGSEFPADATIVKVETADGTIYAAILRDVTRTKELEAELTRLASTDPLTGLLNRRSFTELAEREMARAKRHDHPLTFLMMDIDHFKRVNDTHGHARGDEILRQFAEMCRAEFRQHDLIGRWGGEEFVAALVETDARYARTVAERMRRRVAAAPMLDADQTLTVSIGVAVVNADDATIVFPLGRADDALYTAKRLGRNRVFIDPKSDTENQPSLQQSA